MNPPSIRGAERVFRALLAHCLLIHPAPSVRAANGAGFLSPSFRGSADSESALWTDFTDANGGSNPPNGVAPGGGVLAGASITQDVPGIAFVTGGGNLYSFSGAMQFTLSYNPGFVGDVGMVVLQTETLGTELDYGNVRLNYGLGAGSVSLSTTRDELFRTPLGGFGGSAVGSKWEWDLFGLGVEDFTITFQAAGSSLSLDAAALDTVAVPEPAHAGLLAAGLLAGLVVLRRRRRN
ncbi:MAG TPA: PEP-CTERM sorting domain-containing protein [Verrucomicrobiota bacterium]|nr:PEP-CTERM sorting domain-containing protein [Verrucomicrobiota bacterium]